MQWEGLRVPESFAIGLPASSSVTNDVDIVNRTDNKI